MEFSHNYRNIMNRFACTDAGIYQPTGEDMQKTVECPVKMVFKVNRDGGEIPIMGYSNVVQAVRGMNLDHAEENQFITVVVPLILSSRQRIISGADTIMKVFTQGLGRLLQVNTPKGERYYGGNGVVLDKNFKPLIYVTREFNRISNSPTKTTVHISPLVFTDTEPSLNKALLKKAIAYYLTNRIDYWGSPLDLPKIAIDDGSELFVESNKPTPGEDINKEASSVLKEHIEEVLGQLKYDGTI